MSNKSGRNFIEWYEDLRIYMNSIDENNGLPLNPDDWCCKDEWKAYFNAGIDHVNAFLEER